MKRTAFALIALAISVSVSFAQDKRILDSRTIPDTLRQGACAVIRLDSTTTECKDMKSMTTRHFIAVTVLNSEGAPYGHFIEYTKEGESFRQFKGTLYNAAGVKSRSFGKKELSTSTLSLNTADDYTTHSVELHSPVYPYTIVWEWETACTEGYISLPAFSPAYYTDVSLERATYTLITPQDYEYSYKRVNTDITSQTASEKDMMTAKWIMSGIRPYREDALMPPPGEVLPRIYFTPHKFLYHKRTGEASSWEKYGEWQWSLLEGRDILPQKLKEIVHSITDTIPGRRDKIKALYNYLGKNTRYVSIQLGLGGLQPSSAEDVFKNGFGDCKGLSNLMGSMLKECGIESHYVEVSTKNPVIYKDFASANQTNHVILKVPDPSGDLWLECTNTGIPFGYIHQDISGHDAVVYSNGTAAVERIPSYHDSLNRIETNISIKVSPGGESYIKVKEKYVNMCAEPLLGLASESAERQKEVIISQLSVPSGNIDSIQITEHLEQRPVIELEYVYHSSSLAQFNSSILAVPASIFKENSPKFNRRRELDIHIPKGYIWKSTMTIAVPQGYNIEEGNNSTQITSVCGTLAHKVSQERQIISVENEKRILSGRNSKERIGEIRLFFNAASSIASKKIILRRR